MEQDGPLNILNKPCTTCRVEEGGVPRCKLGFLTQKYDSSKPMNANVEIRGLTLADCSNLYASALKPTPIMVIAAAPSWEEDAGGVAFQGSVGQKIRDLLTKAGLPPDDVYLTYMAKCQAPKGRKPAAAEIKACAGHLQRELEVVQPKHIILLGSETLRLFKLHSLGGVNAIHGKVFDREFNFWEGEDPPTYKVIVSFSPAGLVHNYDANLERRILNDYKSALGFEQPVVKTPLYRKCTTVEEVEELVSEIEKQPWFAFDTESTSLSFRKSPMLCMSLSWKRLHSGPSGPEPKCLNAIIPIFKHDDQPHPVQFQGRTIVPAEKKRGPGFFCLPFWSESDGLKVIQILKRLFENPKIGKAAHNIKYDLNVIRYWLGIKTEGFFFDTMLMHHYLQEQPPHALEELSDMEFGSGPYSVLLKAVTGSGKTLLKTYDHIEDDILYPYSAFDAENVYRLCEIYYARLQKKPHLWQSYCEETEPATRTLAEAEWCGSALDKKVIDDLSTEYLERQDALLIEMRALIPPNPTCPTFEFNPLSTPQVRDALISLGYRKEIEDKQAPSGYCTSKEVLLRLSELGAELPGKILEFRTNRKILSTYLNNALVDLDDDGRVRYSWLLHGTTSGRLSCRFLHQIPRANTRRKKAGKLNLRDMFVVRPGYKYVYLDYSQIELRVLALLGNDEKMLEMFRNGEDIHAATAMCILEGLDAVINDENRNLGKTMNFGLAYGSEGHTLVKTGEWVDTKGQKHPVTWDMVKIGRARFGNLFPGVVDYLETTPDLARTNNGILRTPFGRERRLGSKLNDLQEAIRNAAEREGVNFTIQSTAGAIMIRTLNIVHQQLQLWIAAGQLQEDDIRLINTVHDSGAWEVRADLVDWFQGVLKTIAERKIPELQDMSFPVDMGVGNNWTEAESK